MWYAALMRFIRRRIVLGIIFASSLMYCIISLRRDNKPFENDIQDAITERNHPFIWRTLQEHNDSLSDDYFCRNSIQGKLFVVDDRGYVCTRKDLTKTGCCNPESSSSRRYHCDTCLDNKCCAIYEYCVSCCLHPNKREILQVVLSKLSSHDIVLFKTVNDDYELCLAKCRTNSQSVQHENSYRDSRGKHCYGHEIPGVG